MRDTRRVLVALIMTCVFACGGGAGGGETPDAASGPPDAPISNSICGNMEVEPGEDCDDGDQTADPACTANCKYTCGDGTVNFDEACDTGIASGQGACPTACNDNDSCTTDAVSGSGCQTTCAFADITVPANGDGCCLPGSTYNDDNDCPALCGNDVVEPPTETCDTGIPSGAGSCPTSCNDNIACTQDQLTGTGCAVTCSNTAITQPANDDNCCPPGATDSNDNDCPRTVECGNGRVDNNETCDTAISAGQPGACPTSCNDNQACTTNRLDGAGTCLAACAFPPITTPTNGDACCPSGGNANNDNDCPVECGNRVVEPGEQCDDGNDNAQDGCHECRTVALPPTAFRFTDLDLRDPHITAGLGFICFDVTDNPPPIADFAVNRLIQTAMTSDADMDGLRDFAPVFVMDPLRPSDPTTQVQVGVAECQFQGAQTCTFGDDAPAQVTATNAASGTCMSWVPGTSHPEIPRNPGDPALPVYSPAIGTPSGPCFSSAAQTLSIVLAGIPITLTDARIASQYSGNPPSTTINGLLRGFLSEAQANTILLPADLPLVGGKPLSLVLPGGDPAGADRNCSNYSDKDTHNGVVGWWFYLNFTAEVAPWSE
jgi:cysteine-rich repeat protein